MAVSDPTRAPREAGGFLPIADYAAIGDGHTVALVGRDGSIDWLCLPTSASPSVFAALLDPDDGGRFALEPAVAYDSSRRYLPGTNVLETTFETADGGRVRVTDAMALGPVGLLEGTQVVRRVEAIAGSVPLRWAVEPRFDAGRAEMTVERRHDTLVARSAHHLLAVQAFGAGELRADAAGVRGEVVLHEGDRALLAITAAHDSPLLLHDEKTLDARVDETAALWRQWAASCSYEGPFRDAVERSLLALKLLVFEPTGAIVAAPTTSLPERVGGPRNYDYRFAWVRDMSFALDAVLRTGQREQAHRSFTWLLDAIANTHPRLQPIYGIDGAPPGGQTQLDMPGYRFSQPVNEGNSAADQTQLGNYGDLFATTWLYVTSGGMLDAPTGLRLAQIADLVCDLWPVADSGIWELGDKRHYTVSKMACWLTLDRALRLCECGEIPGTHAARWRAERSAIHAYVMERCWSDSRRTFLRDGDGGSDLDASVLLAARMEFVDPSGPELAGTIEAIQSELGAGGGLLYRYTGMQDEEGAFVACSFWMAEALARAGRADEAASTVESLLGFANDVGLLSEEIDPSSGELRGNFPQGLSHQSLLNACASLAEASA